MMQILLPVLRCRAKWCNSAFVGLGDHCPRCVQKSEKAKRVAALQATRRDITEHKRLSLRKRLGLLTETSA